MEEIIEVRNEKYTYNNIIPCGSNLTAETKVLCCLSLTVSV